MKVTVKKAIEGKRDVFVQRTSRDEGPSVLLTNCTRADMKGVVAETIKQIAAKPRVP